MTAVPSATRLVEQAAARGLPLDPERAEALRPLVASLLGRLRRVAAALGPGHEPPPERLTAARGAP